MSKENKDKFQFKFKFKNYFWHNFTRYRDKQAASKKIFVPNLLLQNRTKYILEISKLKKYIIKMIASDIQIKLNFTRNHLQGSKVK